MASDAVGSERVSRVVGYKIVKGDFRNTTPNLPQRIAIIGEANTANQTSISLDYYNITSAQEAGELFGYGSPIHMAMRILRPVSGDGVGGIPTVVYPQLEVAAASEREFEIEVTGTVTENTSHTLVVAGREVLDGGSYGFTVLTTDTVNTIADRIADAVNNVLGCPFVAVSDTGTVTLTTKWKGATTNGLSLSVNTKGNDAGVAYAVSQVTAGAGTPAVTNSLNLFGEEWNTVVVNTYGLVDTVMDELEAYNGIPDPTSPTGRYEGVIMKPFIALSGSVADDDNTLTDVRKDQVTIATCPAWFSPAHPLEAAANMARLFARLAQDNPHLDVAGLSYPDMPVPASNVDLGLMGNYNGRDTLVKQGMSTATIESGKYKIQDFVTTYHPTGELPPQFRYSRNLMLDFNVRFGYYVLEQINVVDHVIANNDDEVTATKVIKPKQWKAIVGNYADDLARRALIVNADFMRESIDVGISTVNPDRLETTFRYKRSGVARISATTAEAGFNFGEV